MVLDAAHEKSTESSSGPKREEIMESVLFKCSDFVVVQFKDTDSSYARRGRLGFPQSSNGVMGSLQQQFSRNHTDLVSLHFTQDLAMWLRLTLNS